MAFGAPIWLLTIISFVILFSSIKCKKSDELEVNNQSIESPYVLDNNDHNHDDSSNSIQISSSDQEQSFKNAKLNETIARESINDQIALETNEKNNINDYTFAPTIQKSKNTIEILTDKQDGSIIDEKVKEKKEEFKIKDDIFPKYQNEDDHKEEKTNSSSQVIENPRGVSIKNLKDLSEDENDSDNLPNNVSHNSSLYNLDIISSNESNLSNISNFSIDKKKNITNDRIENGKSYNINRYSADVNRINNVFDQSTSEETQKVSSSSNFITASTFPSLFSSRYSSTQKNDIQNKINDNLKEDSDSEIESKEDYESIEIVSSNKNDINKEPYQPNKSPTNELKLIKNSNENSKINDLNSIKFRKFQKFDDNLSKETKTKYFLKKNDTRFNLKRYQSQESDKMNFENISSLMLNSTDRPRLVISLRGENKNNQSSEINSILPTVKFTPYVALNNHPSNVNPIDDDKNDIRQIKISENNIIKRGSTRFIDTISPKPVDLETTTLFNTGPLLSSLLDEDKTTSIENESLEVKQNNGLIETSSVSNFINKKPSLNELSFDSMSSKSTPESYLEISTKVININKTLKPNSIEEIMTTTVRNNDVTSDSNDLKINNTLKSNSIEEETLFTKKLNENLNNFNFENPLFKLLNNNTENSSEKKVFDEEKEITTLKDSKNQEVSLASTKFFNVNDGLEPNNINESLLSSTTLTSDESTYYSDEDYTSSTKFDSSSKESVLTSRDINDEKTTKSFITVADFTTNFYEPTTYKPKDYKIISLLENNSEKNNKYTTSSDSIISTTSSYITETPASQFEKNLNPKTTTISPSAKLSIKDNYLVKSTENENEKTTMKVSLNPKNIEEFKITSQEDETTKNKDFDLTTSEENQSIKELSAKDISKNNDEFKTTGFGDLLKILQNTTLKTSYNDINKITNELTIKDRTKSESTTEAFSLLNEFEKLNNTKFTNLEFDLEKTSTNLWDNKEDSNDEIDVNDFIKLNNKITNTTTSEATITNKNTSKENPIHTTNSVHFTTQFNIENNEVLKSTTFRVDLNKLNEIPATIKTTTSIDDVPTESTEDEELKEKKTTTIVAIIIASVAAVCLILLVALLILVRKRQKRFNYGQRCTPVSLDAYSLDSVSVNNSVRGKRARASKRSYRNAAFDDPASVSNSLNFPELINFSTNDEQIEKEFNEITQITVHTNEVPPGCEDKNRYANVIPLPETRVVLSKIEGDVHSDYINANYVHGFKNARGYYIATQGPLPNTVDDFWRMIWERNSRVILMLTNLVENGIDKCVDYLPPSEVLDCKRQFGDFQVTLKKREVKEKYIISSLQLKNMVANSWREITHLWYLGWPERGVPNETNSIIAYLIEARSYLKTTNASDTTPNLTNGKSNSLENGNETIETSNGYISNSSSNEISSTEPENKRGPIVIHCSPGTGRTGTVIACDLAIREFELTRQVNIPKTVYRIRRDRAGAVQTKEQYAFIYKVLNTYATKLTGGSLDSI